MTTLRVAEKFEKSHLSSPEVAPLIENAKYFYVEGYFLTHGVESVLELSSKASAAGKVRSDMLFNPAPGLTKKKKNTIPDLRAQLLRTLHGPILRRPNKPNPAIR